MKKNKGTTTFGLLSKFMVDESVTLLAKTAIEVRIGCKVLQ